jgi:hypothetical protein
VSEQAKNASAIVDEAHGAGVHGSHPVTLQAKMLRLELLNVKADLERELGRLLLPLHVVRSNGSLSIGAQRVARTLCAPGTRAARGTSPLTRRVARPHERSGLDRSSPAPARRPCPDRTTSPRP